jgi:hypothetical protein
VDTAATELPPRISITSPQDAPMMGVQRAVPELEVDFKSGVSSGALTSSGRQHAQVPIMAVHVSRPATSRALRGWWGSGEQCVEAPYEERLV